jgi:hypothetical protein
MLYASITLLACYGMWKWVMYMDRARRKDAMC